MTVSCILHCKTCAVYCDMDHLLLATFNTKVGSESVGMHLAVADSTCIIIIVIILNTGSVKSVNR